MKKKLTITIASILSVIVIIGVGFAAWVITNPNAEDTADGSISVETVTDKSYSLTAAISDGAISFGAPKIPDAEATKGWLKNDVNTENLTATLTLKLNYKYWSVIPENLKLKIEAGTVLGESFEKDAGTKFEGLVEASILKNPTISYDEKTTNTPVTVTMNGAEVEIPKTAFGSADTTNSDTAKTATATIKITFGWGTAFGSEKPENPYNYYNKRDYSAELAKEANEKLTKLYNALNGVSYKVTVTGTTAA